MPAIVEMLFVLVVACGPFIGYMLMLRRAERTRGKLILAAILGSALPAALLCAAAVVLGGSTLELLPWALIAAAYGLTIGVLGVLARIIGEWLASRQP